MFLPEQDTLGIKFWEILIPFKDIKAQDFLKYFVHLSKHSYCQNLQKSHLFL